MSDATILITRPKGDEQALTDKLHEKGLRVIHEPLTEIFLIHTERQAIQNALLADPDAVLITSKHGAQALALLTDFRDPHLICVGDATAEVAMSLGFTRVSVAGGTVQKLIEYVFESYDPGSRFLYPCAQQVRVELDAVLETQGMQVERIAIYEALAAQALSDTLIEQLKRQQIDGVTFMSVRSAQIFGQLLKKADIAGAMPHLQAFCLSDAIAQFAHNLPFKAVHTSDQPTLASMAECVDNVF